MRAEFNRHIAVVGQMQIRVMVFLPGDFPDSIEKQQGSVEILRVPFPADSPPVAVQLPMVNILEQEIDLLGIRAGVPPSDEVQCIF